jgi:hypothetical protein
VNKSRMLVSTLSCDRLRESCRDLQPLLIVDSK